MKMLAIMSSSLIIYETVKRYLIFFVWLSKSIKKEMRLIIHAFCFCFMYKLFIIFIAWQYSTCHYIINCLSIYPSPAHELLDDF